MHFLQHCSNISGSTSDMADYMLHRMLKVYSVLIPILKTLTTEMICYNTMSVFNWESWTNIEMQEVTILQGIIFSKLQFHYYICYVAISICFSIVTKCLNKFFFSFSSFLCWFLNCFTIWGFSPLTLC